MKALKIFAGIVLVVGCFYVATLLQAALGKCPGEAQAQGPRLAAIVDVTSDSGRTWSIVRMIPEDSAHYFEVGWRDSTGAIQVLRIRWFCPVRAPSQPQGEDE